jgi:predicted peptidase
MVVEVVKHMRRTPFVAATAVTLSLIASLGLSRQIPRLEITPGTVLVDERFRISLDGLKPGQAVTIRVDGNRGAWHSSAAFHSDDRGRVEIADPMRLIWSATGTPVPAARRLPVPQPWVFTAEVDGRAIATQTILRRALAEHVRVVPVRERGLVGTAYFPAQAGPHSAMIVLPGSQGGIPGPGAHAGGLASRGYVVLALAYFNAEGLPPLLQNIPLEYFATAVAWLKSQPSVAPGRIGVLGTSRGGELALLLGATYPSLFRVVVANVPSNVVWPGLSDDSDAPAWTLNGVPVPGIPRRWTSADLALSGRDRFLKRMQDPTAARAEIQVERIDAPVLMFSGKDDQLWPSDIFAARVADRLKAHQFKHPVEHYSYAHAGHQITRPFTPTSAVREVRIHPVSKRPNMAGGTPEGQARANEDSWEKLFAFLDKYLRSAPAGSSAAQDAVDGFVARSFKAASGVTMPYRLFVPELAARKQPLPLVVYLHGGGGIGTDNLKQISGGNANGTHVWTTADAQRTRPAFVLAPQLPENQAWAVPATDALSAYAQAALEIVATLSREFAIDSSRIYLTGQSLGGRGTWDIISKRPDVFAAAVPLCGDGSASRIVAARGVPIWAFHGAKDPLVPVAGSRDLVAALQRAGSPVKYTEYPDVEHNVWTRAYVDPQLHEWLFRQRRATATAR